ncbi:MAG: transcription antitermination factor NusB [Nocardioidaceae bacterium]|nr:transcription antitermination factor NusB [Nocardioidaceae bacterium]
MGARTKARKRALDLLYGAELRGQPLADALVALDGADPGSHGGRPLNDYTVTLIRGVSEHQARIDSLLEDFAVGWTLNRMPAVDRNLLRIGVFEVLMVDDVPPGVAISEAVHLAHELSTDESPRFVNGLLARVAERRPTLTG